MNTTPTPGDLSARQVIADMQSVAELRTIRHSYIGEKLKGWIAALSALPAAGGELVGELLGYGRISGDAQVRIKKGLPPGTKLYTTPQPSAAEKVGCEGDDGLLRIHAESETCDVCAAVGAQGVALGDGDFYGNGSNLPSLHSDPAINAEILIAALCARLDTARVALAAAAAMQVVEPKLAKIKANASWAMDETKPSRVLPRSAPVAPAAGKGVDDAALGRAYRRWYGAAKGYKDVDADAAHDFITREAALTRQPVAGDGWRPIETAPQVESMLSDIPRCLVYSKDFGIQMGRAWRYADGEARGQGDGFNGEWNVTHFHPLPAAPAATPTDGGEG